MDRRNALISITLLGTLLGACSSVPRPPSPRHVPRPEEDAGDPLDAMLACDRDSRRDDVITVAMSQVGTPYMWGGGSPLIGFDCSGFVAYVFQQALHMNLPRVAFEQAQLARPVPDEGLRPADLVFFNTLGHQFSHVGIYVGRTRFIHAPAAGTFVRIESMAGDYWRNHYDGARRVIV